MICLGSLLCELPRRYGAYTPNFSNVTLMLSLQCRDLFTRSIFFLRRYIHLPTWLFTNLCLRQNPKSYKDTNQFRIRLSTDQISGNAKESIRDPEIPDEICAQNQAFEVGKVSGTAEEFIVKPLNPDGIFYQSQFFNVNEIAKEVSAFIRTQSRWEQTLMSIFPNVNFVDPNIYNKVVKQQNNVFLSIRFYLWLKSLNGFLLDPILCKEMFSKLVEVNAAKAAESFLEETKFEPEPESLELYIECLCENGLVDKAFDMFERLKKIGHCALLRTWNSALSCTVRTERLDVFWALYGNMMQHNVVPDIDTIGYLTRAFCIDNNAAKGYKILRQVLEDGHVPSKIVFNKLIAAFCKSGDYGKMSSTLHMMIAMNCSPDIYTYQEVINGLNKRKMRYEGFRVFNDLKCRGYFPDRVMYTTMIHGLCENKWLGDARKLWFEMTRNGIVPNEYTYNAFINGLWHMGSTDEAEKLYKEMISKGYGESTICYNTMISGMCLNGKVDEARALFEQMKEKGIASDAITYNSLMKGFSQDGNLAEGLYFFHELLKLGFEPSTASFTILMERLCESGHVEEAKKLWQDVLDRGMEAAVFSQNKIVVALVEQGCFEEGIAWLKAMIRNSMTPEKKTFENLIQSLCVADRLDDALLVLDYMLKMGFSLEECVCNSLVNKLCQDGSRIIESCLEKIL